MTRYFHMDIRYYCRLADRQLMVIVDGSVNTHISEVHAVMYWPG